MNIAKNIFLLIIIGFILSACQTNKYIPEGKYLLVDNDIKAADSEIPDREYQQFLRQKPNKKIFGFWRFHMGLYNLSNPEKETGFHNWLRRIGEAPVIYDPFIASKSSAQISAYLYNKGYHQSVVIDSIQTRGFKAKGQYLVYPGDPYIINRIQWLTSDLVSDHRMKKLLAPDSSQFTIHSGDRFDLDRLQDERIALTSSFKELGYYAFSKEYVYFEADTFADSREVNLKLGIAAPVDTLPSSERQHKRYRFNHIQIVGDFDPLAFMKHPESYYASSDTLKYEGIDFIYNDQLSLKENLLFSTLYIEEGALFQQSLVDKTNAALSNLQNFRTINFKFEPLDSLTVDSVHLLDCRIELNPMIRQSYDISLEGTHSSGNLGMAGNLIYNHRNLFRGAENFELKFRGAIEFLTNAKSDINQMIEFGVQTRLNVPHLWLPVNLGGLQKKYNPKSSITFNYNYQQRPEITRTIASAGLGYHWKSSTKISHRINIIDLNYVNVTDMSDRFRDLITGTYLEASYQSHVIPAFNYSIIFSNQQIDRDKNYFFINFRPEIAGNVFSLFNLVAGNERPPDGYLLFNTPYSQYGMADIDLRYHQVLNESNRMVYRLYSGVGYPYGNAQVMPFEKRYFSGGSNGIRAWQVRSLGPGSYVLPEGLEDQYPNQLGDVKIEANLEYRFDLFWHLKGAVFLDAGNIWTIRPDENQPGADFEWNRFYNEIAVGSGMGIRLDLSFVVVRLDLGMKFRDPAKPGGPGWIPFSRPYRWNDFMLNFAIGYPF